MSISRSPGDLHTAVTDFYGGTSALHDSGVEGLGPLVFGQIVREISVAEPLLRRLVVCAPLTEPLTTERNTFALALFGQLERDDYRPRFFKGAIVAPDSTRSLRDPHPFIHPQEIRSMLLQVMLAGEGYQHRSPGHAAIYGQKIIDAYHNRT